jgi:hypothetical protein
MIDLVSGIYYITDLASTNGCVAGCGCVDRRRENVRLRLACSTFLDGEELAAGAPVPLNAGSELVIGDEFLCKFIVEFSS